MIIINTYIYIIMELVDPSNFIPGEYYYLENNSDDKMKALGIFRRTHEGKAIFGGEQAVFTIVPLEKIKSKKMNAYLNDTRGFPINSYKFYKPLPQEVIDRHQQKEKENRLTAFEKMINKETLPNYEINLSTMYATPAEKNPTFYGSDPDKSNIGSQLKNTYGAYLGGRRRKSRKSRKSRKTKSRRRR